MPSQLTLLHPLLLLLLLRQPLLLLQLKRLRSNSWKSFLAVKEKPRSAGFFFRLAIKGLNHEPLKKSMLFDLVR
jgi:hypothetical protein